MSYRASWQTGPEQTLIITVRQKKITIFQQQKMLNKIDKQELV